MDRHDGMSRRRSGGAATSSSRRRARRFRCAVTLGSLAISALCLTLAAAADETGDALAAATAMPTARPFDGVHAVGALFRDVAGKLRHFCTAAVVRSRRGDLLITAAHCLDGKVSPGGDVASVRFAPGFHGRAFPYGTLAVTFEYVDSNWHRYHDPDDNVAFLVVGRNIEKSTGAERVATGQKMPQQVQVIGYPDSTDTPVTCLAPGSQLLHQAVCATDLPLRRLHRRHERRPVPRSRQRQDGNRRRGRGHRRLSGGRGLR